MRLFVIYLALLLLLGACGKKTDREAPAGPVLFADLPADSTGIRFENRVVDTQTFNIFNYRNFYNGGGVAIGDVNNDGLPTCTSLPTRPKTSFSESKEI
jgi:hypothetical protein